MGETGMSLIKLEPVYKKSIWAGERLTKIRGLTASGIGISREVCAYQGSENVIAAGPMKGEAVGRLIADYHRELMGEDIPRLALLVISNYGCLCFIRMNLN